MYIWKVLLSLFYYEFGSPANYLLPIVFVAGGLLQVLCIRRLSGKKRWLAAAVLLACVLICEVSLWLIRSYTALLVVIAMHFFMAALLGAAAGGLCCKLWTKVHHS